MLHVCRVEPPRVIRSRCNYLFLCSSVLRVRSADILTKSLFSYVIKSKAGRILIPPFPGSNPGAPASHRGLFQATSCSLQRGHISAG
jgi:hypothetical protein